MTHHPCHHSTPTTQTPPLNVPLAIFCHRPLTVFATPPHSLCTALATISVPSPDRPNRLLSRIRAVLRHQAWHQRSFHARPLSANLTKGYQTRRLPYQLLLQSCCLPPCSCPSPSPHPSPSNCVPKRLLLWLRVVLAFPNASSSGFSSSTRRSIPQPPAAAAAPLPLPPAAAAAFPPLLTRLPPSPAPLASAAPLLPPALPLLLPGLVRLDPS